MHVAEADAAMDGPWRGEPTCLFRDEFTLCKHESEHGTPGEGQGHDFTQSIPGRADCATTPQIGCGLPATGRSVGDTRVLRNGAGNGSFEIQVE